MASRFPLTQKIEEFVSDVLPLLGPGQYKDRWKDRLARRWTAAQAEFADHTTDSTKRLYANRFRTALKEGIAEMEESDTRRDRVIDAALEIVRLDPALMKKLNDEYREGVEDNNRDLAVMEHWRELAEEFRALLGHPSAELKAVALMALTGRRFVEILQTGTLEQVVEVENGVRTKHRYLLKFTGQAKTRQSENTMWGKTYIIPVLAPANEILRAFRKMRNSPQGKLWQSVTLKNLNTSHNTPLNVALRGRMEIARYWPKSVKLSLKTLRPFYAEVAYEVFGPRMTKTPYFAKILGHGEDNLQTALSYMIFCLSEQSKVAGQEEMNRLVMMIEKQRTEAIAAKAAEDGGADDGSDEDGEVIEDDESLAEDDQP